MEDYSGICNAIPVIFSDEIYKGSLFHYTSLTGFLLMLENIREKECCIFPGHTRYQNDAQELSEGFSFVKENLSMLSSVKSLIPHSLESLNNNIYIACFSSDGDLLEQWKYYGDNCGLSVEFDFDQCEVFLSKNQKIGETFFVNRYDIKEYTSISNDKKHSLMFDESDVILDNSDSIITRGGISLFPIKVLYKDAEKSQLLKKILETDLKINMEDLALADTTVNREQYIDSAISIFVPICKSIYFEHEKESRLLFFPLNGAELFYREKNNRILPYLKCRVVNKDAEKYPIISVTVGPGNNQNLIFNSVINMLEGQKNNKFFSDEECDNVLKNNSFYKNLKDLKQNAKYGELCCYLKDNKDKVLTYLSNTGIYIYKSPIPFRN